uniref:40S ribosomal protein S15 n=2 Tax=Clytia hemisphaerica TaxID=252671 RepID=A0A7M5V0D8_9CNID
LGRRYIHRLFPPLTVSSAGNFVYVFKNKDCSSSCVEVSFFAGFSKLKAKMDPTAAAELKKKRTFKKFSFRGVDLDQLLDLSSEQLMDLVHARARRRFGRGLKMKPLALMKKLRKAKKEAAPMEKPAVVKTHLRNMIVLPDMIGSIVGVHNGKTFNQVEIKPEMIGHYLGEFSMTYKPVRHGRPGIGATHSSRFIPLK